MFRLFKFFTRSRPQREAPRLDIVFRPEDFLVTDPQLEWPPIVPPDAPAPEPTEFDFARAVAEARSTLAASPHLSPKARQMLCDMTWTPPHPDHNSV